MRVKVVGNDAYVFPCFSAGASLKHVNGSRLAEERRCFPLLFGGGLIEAFCAARPPRERL